jgi:hypothetical protein
MVVADGRIRIGDIEAPLVVRRSTRARRPSIRVDPCAGAVTLVLPARGGATAASRFLADSAGWIERRLVALPPPVPFADGAVIPLRGCDHRIRHRPQGDGSRRVVWCEAGEIHVAGKPEHLPRRLRDWLIVSARAELGARAQALAASVERTIRRVAIRDMRSRWGSCSADGRLAFSWRLLLAPEFVIDYIVAHEVAHLVHMNHGARFWSLVRRLAADADAARRWLVRHGAGLYRYG